MNFSDVINRWTEDVKGSVQNITTELVFKLGESFITLTPVLTGRLKGNWIATLHSSSTHSRVRYDGTGQETIDDLITTLNSYELGDSIYIVNNLTYSEFIEYGGSKWKAPDGMFRISMSKFDVYLREAVDKFKVR